MADVTGPISTLPGASHALPPGTMCDTHPDRPAVARIQGETDSMGSEMNDCCQECVDEIRNAPAAVGTCDWCKTPKVELVPKRDYDEGMNGPVYRVCNPCAKRYDDRQVEDMMDHVADDDYD